MFAVAGNRGRRSSYKIYFATAPEAFNMVISAIEGKTGTAGEF